MEVMKLLCYDDIGITDVRLQTQNYEEHKQLYLHG
jgi:hypothetical protein